MINVIKMFTMTGLIVDKERPMSGLTDKSKEKYGFVRNFDGLKKMSISGMVVGQVVTLKI